MHFPRKLQQPSEKQSNQYPPKGIFYYTHGFPICHLVTVSTCDNVPGTRTKSTRRLLDNNERMV